MPKKPFVDFRDKQSHIIIMLDENDAGRAGRTEVAARLSQHCFVKTHVFDQPDAEPEHLTADEVAQIPGGAA